MAKSFAKTLKNQLLKKLHFLTSHYMLLKHIIKYKNNTHHHVIKNMNIL
jgi:hypothetical protein